MHLSAALFLRIKQNYVPMVLATYICDSNKLFNQSRTLLRVLLAKNDRIHPIGKLIVRLALFLCKINMKHTLFVIWTMSVMESFCSPIFCSLERWRHSFVLMFRYSANSMIVNWRANSCGSISSKFSLPLLIPSS